MVVQLYVWAFLIAGLLYLTVLFYIYKKKLEVAQNKITQSVDFCAQFMEAIIQLMDELEAKKEKIDQLLIKIDKKNMVCTVDELNIDDEKDRVQYNNVFPIVRDEHVVVNDTSNIYNRIGSMLEEGLSVDEIAKMIDIGVGELRLIISLHNLQQLKPDQND